MSSIKCPQCGLVNWSTAENCKRCGLAIAASPAEDSEYDQNQAYAAPPPAGSFMDDSLEEEEWTSRLKRDSRLFYVIGGLQILLWFVVGNLLIVDGLFNIGLSYVANKFRSRIAAIALALLTLLSVLAALMALATGALRFNLLTPIVLIGRIVASVRMVYCTFKLNALVKDDASQMMPPLPPEFHQEAPAQWAPTNVAT